MLDEARDLASSRSALYPQNLRQYHSRRVQGRAFSVGELVLWLKQKGHHKLSLPWEGPYIVNQVLGNGAYRLKDPTTDVVYNNP